MKAEATLTDRRILAGKCVKRNRTKSKAVNDTCLKAQG